MIQISFILLSIPLNTLGDGAISSTPRNILTLLGRRAHTSSAAAEARSTALGLALVILEHKEAIGPGLELSACKRLIRRSVTPPRNTVARRELHAVKGANRRILLSRAASIL
jgi:hypothetical protein